MALGVIAFPWLSHCFRHPPDAIDPSPRTTPFLAKCFVSASREIYELPRGRLNSEFFCAAGGRRCDYFFLYQHSPRQLPFTPPQSLFGSGGVSNRLSKRPVAFKSKSPRGLSHIYACIVSLLRASWHCLFSPVLSQN